MRMDPADALRLRKILDKGGRADLKAANLTKGTAAPFEGKGYLRLVLDGKKTMVELTDSGRIALREFDEEQARLPKVEKPKVRGRAPSQGDALAGLAEQLANVITRLARIEAAFGAGSNRRPASDVDLPSVKELVLRTIAELDAARRYGGLVPIPEIRKAVEAHQIPDDAVTNALEELENEYVIDLNIAQASTAVADRKAGIERPGRGLLYYVARRSS